MLSYLQDPARQRWPELIQRAQVVELSKEDSIQERTRAIVNHVRSDGVAALEEYSVKFDQLELEQVCVSIPELSDLGELGIKVADDFRSALTVAVDNVKRFHEQSRSCQSYNQIETTAGVHCWRKTLPIERVGIYVPGGTAPLLSVLYMLYIPAKLAGCNEIVICTPPLPVNSRSGELPISAEWIYTASILGIKKVLALGGAQAIAALAFGSYQALLDLNKNYNRGVDKIVGPGNQYVTAAKQYISATTSVAIDMPAGPTEMLTIVDGSSRLDFVAADVLSQLEHGIDSQVLVVTCDSNFRVDQLQSEIQRQLDLLPRKLLAQESIKHSKMIEFAKSEDLFDFVNLYAPEHLIINTKNSLEIAEQISNAGSVFLGPYTPESLGDYASGTNNTLPTAGAARAFSGITVESFQKTITFQKASYAGLKALAPTVESLAEAEQLEGHARAVRIRRTDLLS